jgi:hypothetical protein
VDGCRRRVRNEGEGKLNPDEQPQHAGGVCGDSPRVVCGKTQPGKQRKQCNARGSSTRGSSAHWIQARFSERPSDRGGE